MSNWSNAGPTSAKTKPQSKGWFTSPSLTAMTGAGPQRKYPGRYRDLVVLITLSPTFGWSGLMFLGRTVTGLLGRRIHHLPSRVLWLQVDSLHEHLVPAVVVPVRKPIYYPSFAEKTAKGWLLPPSWFINPNGLIYPMKPTLWCGAQAMRQYQMESRVLRLSGVPSGLKMSSVFRLPVLSWAELKLVMSLAGIPRHLRTVDKELNINSDLA